ncbi:urea transporter [Scopulibacillus cellulosilyticus]|uniref:Urea transporter n=1 Tax=Scopulibacillus cellulosilyticus TaxID=2665665 RepID=A0ABW2Q1S2_9BACL
MQNSKQSSFTNGAFFSLISASLKGISQVILIENALTGLIILIAIAIASLPIGIITIASALIGTLIGHAGGADQKTVKQGLFGYNSVLAGIALSLNLTGGQRWIIALAGAAVAALLTAAMMHVMRSSGIPVLTFPFIAVTWIVLLASYHLGLIKLSPNLVPQTLSHWKLSTIGHIDWKDGLVRGIGQIFLQDKFWSGIIILIGIFCAGWKLGLYTALGTVIGWVSAYMLGADITSINLGLYGYNAVLTIIAVAAVFDIRSRFAPLTGIIAAIVTVPITAGVDSYLLPFGLPALTMPFVLTSWLFIGARKVFPKL